MKNTANRTQRNFVVEYKSTRRQLRDGAKSIWGDTDLKAMVRAVADDMPDPKITSNHGDAQRNAQQDVAVREAEHHSPATVAMDENQVASVRPDIQEAADGANETPNVSDPVSGPKRKRETGSVATARATKRPSKPKPSISAQPPASFATLSEYDILSILEMENRRLKELLMEKLRSENMLLREKLQRF